MGQNGRPIVLVVEDEFLTRTDAAEIISEAGFEVLQAANADEAIVILEARSDIRIIFTDINMPGSMDGLKLAHAVRNRWPPIEIIVASAAILKPGDQLPDRGVFMQKPYDAGEIKRALHAFIG